MMTPDAPTTWTPLLALLAGVLLAWSTAWWWPRARRWLRRWWLIRRAARDLRRFHEEQEQARQEARNRAIGRVREVIEREREKKRLAGKPEPLDDPWFEGRAAERSRRDG